MLDTIFSGENCILNLIILGGSNKLKSQSFKNNKLNLKVLKR